MVLKAFTMVILGGLGSIPGAVAGGVYRGDQRELRLHPLRRGSRALFLCLDHRRTDSETAGCGDVTKKRWPKLVCYLTLLAILACVPLATSIPTICR